MDLPGNIPLYTRLGRTEIPNAQDQDPPPEKSDLLTKVLGAKHPRARRRRKPSGQYNCHGLTFANRRTGIYDRDSVVRILNEDGYRRIDPSEVRPGDLAVYHDGGQIDHTGIVLDLIKGANELADTFLPLVISKWGSASEYVHLANDCPYDFATVAYFTDRLKSDDDTQRIR